METTLGNLFNIKLKLFFSNINFLKDLENLLKLG